MSYSADGRPIGIQSLGDTYPQNLVLAAATGTDARIVDLYEGFVGPLASITMTAIGTAGAALAAAYQTQVGSPMPSTYDGWRIRDHVSSTGTIYYNSSYKNGAIVTPPASANLAASVTQGSIAAGGPGVPYSDLPSLSVSGSGDGGVVTLDSGTAHVGSVTVEGTIVGATWALGSIGPNAATTGASPAMPGRLCIVECDGQSNQTIYGRFEESRDGATLWTGVPFEVKSAGSNPSSETDGTFNIAWQNGSTVHVHHREGYHLRCVTDSIGGGTLTMTGYDFAADSLERVGLRPPSGVGGDAPRKVGAMIGWIEEANQTGSVTFPGSFTDVKRTASGYYPAVQITDSGTANANVPVIGSTVSSPVEFTLITISDSKAFRLRGAKIALTNKSPGSTTPGMTGARISFYAKTTDVPAKYGRVFTFPLAQGMNDLGTLLEKPLPFDSGSVYFQIHGLSNFVIDITPFGYTRN